MEEQSAIDIVDHQIKAHRNHHRRPHWYLDAEVKGTLKSATNTSWNSCNLNDTNHTMDIRNIIWGISQHQYIGIYYEWNGTGQLNGKVHWLGLEQ